MGRVRDYVGDSGGGYFGDEGEVIGVECGDFVEFGGGEGGGDWAKWLWEKCYAENYYGVIASGCGRGDF